MKGIDLQDMVFFGLVFFVLGIIALTAYLS